MRTRGTRARMVAAKGGGIVTGAVSFDDVVSRLNARPNGSGHKAKCPAHDDREPSLSIGAGDDGRVLLKCHAGCSTEAICDAMGIAVADLFPGGSAVRKRTTIAELAAHKKHSADFLRSLGIHDLDRGGIGIPYRDTDGNVVSIKGRGSLVAKEGSWWVQGKPLAYGLDRLVVARELDYVVLVEGESDCWALWANEIPALGVPGADLTKVITPKLLDGIAKIYAIREPDNGGDKFIAGLTKQIGADRFIEVRLDGAKDPAELYAKNPATFKAQFAAVLEKATPQAPSLPPTAAELFRSDAFKKPQRLYPTGIADLDELTRGGFRSGKVTFICGPTGGGKTGFVGTIANNYLAKGVPVLAVETELEAAEKAARFASNRFHIKGWRACPDDFLGHVIVPEKGAEILDDAPLYIINVDDDPDPFTTIRNAAAAIQAKHGQPPVIVIDYVQCIAYDGEEIRVSTIGVVKQCRRLARDFDCCVIAISSVARAFQGRNRRLKNPDGTEDPLDWLTAAAESSVIEYTGAVIAYLDTADEVDALGESAARLIVCKSRGGRRGFVGLRFHGPSGAFRAAPESLEAMGMAAKSNRDDDRVLAFIQSTDYQPMPKRQLRTAIKGMGATSVDAAVDRLVAAKRITPIKNPNPRARGELLVKAE